MSAVVSSNSGRFRKPVIIGVIVVVAILAVGAVVAVQSGWLSGQDGIKRPKICWFHCVQPKCGNEWSISALEVEDLLKAKKAVLGPVGPQLDCPKCRSRASGQMMSQCPACGQFYFLAQPFNPTVMQTERICPKCHVDLNQWVIDQRRR